MACEYVREGDVDLVLINNCISRYNVFTLSKLGERFATLPPGHRSTHRVALGVRRAPPGSAPMHYLRMLEEEEEEEEEFT